MNTFSDDRKFVSKFWRPLVTAVCLGAALFATGPARGGLVLSAQTVTVNAGTTGNVLDVTLFNSGPSTVTIGGFAIEVVAGTSAINFTDATINTAAPYIFVGHSLFGPDIATLTGQTLDASDAYDTINAGGTVISGATVGVAHIIFNASLSASGSIAVTLTPFPGSSLSDPLGNNVPITSLSNGTINISGGTTPVPEPATFGPAVFAILVGLWKARSLRRKS